MTDFRFKLKAPEQAEDGAATHLFASVGFDRVGPRAVRYRVVERDGTTSELDLIRRGLTKWSRAISAKPGQDLDILLSIEGEGWAHWAKMALVPISSPVGAGVGGGKEVGGGAGDGGGADPPVDGSGPDGPEDPADLPSAWLERARAQVRGQDESDAALARRADLFFALDLASAPALIAPGVVGDDARKTLSSIDGRLEQLRPPDVELALAHLTEAVARVLDGQSLIPTGDFGLVGPAEPGTLIGLERVQALFENLTAVRYGVPNETPVRLNEWTGRALVADVVRFACGSLRVEHCGLANLMNCAPNGGFFAFFPTLAATTYERVKASDNFNDGPKLAIWEWWVRATLAGLEAFLDVCDSGNGKRDFARYRDPFAGDGAAERRWSRGRIADVVERYSGVDPASFRRHLSGGLLTMFADLSGEDFRRQVNGR